MKINKDHTPEQKENKSDEGIHYPLISIGIPTYNSNGKIVKALLSVWRQEYPNIEIIVSDNCSTDNTEQLCEGLSKDFLPIKYFKQPRNIGLIPNFQFVLDQATGDYFMWLSDDDTLEEGILIRYLDFLMSNPEYTLVSGQILYWEGDKPVFVEKDFTMEHAFPALRVIQFYCKVVHGAIYYGLMTRENANRVPLRHCIGNDWHYVASLAYLGKIKNLDCIGYHKKLGGASSSFREYAATIEAGWFSADFPRTKIAIDAFADILYGSPIFSTMPVYSRFGVAFVSGAGILLKYYLTEFPMIIGGRVKRFFQSAFGFRELEKIKDHA